MSNNKCEITASVILLFISNIEKLIRIKPYCDKFLSPFIQSPNIQQLPPRATSLSQVTAHFTRFLFSNSSIASLTIDCSQPSYRSSVRFHPLFESVPVPHINVDCVFIYRIKRRFASRPRFCDIWLQYEMLISQMSGEIVSGQWVRYRKSRVCELSTFVRMLIAQVRGRMARSMIFAIR